MIGAATGAVAGAISGGPGLGAAAGAAGGATAGLLRGLFTSSDLDAGQQRYERNVSVKKGTTQTAGNRERLNAGQVGKNWAQSDKT